MSSDEIIYSVPETDEILASIGEGGLGKVNLVRHFGEILARKEVKFNSKEIENKFSELDLVKMLKHKSVVGLEDYFIDIDKMTIYIYTKYYEKGDLCKIIDGKKEEREDFSFYVFSI